MFQLLLLAMAFPLLLPNGQDASTHSPSWNRLPVALVAGRTPATTGEAGFDAGAAVHLILQGSAGILQLRGLQVERTPNGDFIVAPYPAPAFQSTIQDDFPLESTAGSRVLTLSVAFSQSVSQQASGTETRFGGHGDEAWRLASRVQRHVMGGLSDVMGYRSYDRGIVEQDEGGTMSGRPDGIQNGDAWVVSYPLLPTNPAEREMLDSPDTLGLLSLALADAVSDYLSPYALTPPRDPKYGWAQFAPWKPVVPRLVTEAEQSTRLALTFDAASYPPLQPAILATLRDAGVRCTMFLTGDFVDRYPEVVVQMVKDGHEIGNHSDTHPDMPSISATEMVSELEALDAKVVALTGKSTRPWFRPPSGAYNDLVVEVAAQQGYHTIYWTADSADWRPDVDAATVEGRLLRYSAPGAILVQHLTSPQSAEVMPEVIRILKERGLEFGTLSEVLGALDRPD